MGRLKAFKVEKGVDRCVEATNYTLRTVSYQLRAAMCHYGEVPEGLRPYRTPLAPCEMLARPRF